MWSFLSELVRKPKNVRTVMVLDETEVGQARRYQLRPRRLFLLWGGTLFLAGLIASTLLAFTPLRTFIPGYGTEELRQNARLNAIRVSALQDSLAVQQKYIKRLRQLITGRVDSVAQGSESPGSQQVQPGPEAARRPSAAGSAGENEAVQGRPSLSSPARSAGERGAGPMEASGRLPSLGLPAGSPVANGFPTRGFDARDGHYGVDVAVSEGTRVRAIASGYVVLADWMQGGGHTIAVQHADGYLSVYKHNKRLLKQTGDRVRVQEALAVSGNTGQITTGPHVHFEVWRNGLAQNPRSYITSW